jgi:hypothetical protein
VCDGVAAPRWVAAYSGLSGALAADNLHVVRVVTVVPSWLISKHN